MRNVVAVSIVVLCVSAGIGGAQQRSMKITADVAGILGSSPVRCAGCDMPFSASVGAGTMIRNKLGLGVRGIKWRTPTQRLRVAFLTADWYPKTDMMRGKVQPVIGGGAGVGSVKVIADKPGNLRDEFVDSGIPFVYGQFGVDVLALPHVAVRPFLAVTASTRTVNQWECGQTYLAFDDPTWYCDNPQPRTLAHAGFGIALRIR